MRADRPKQYLALGAHTLLERSVRCLLDEVRVQRIFVVVAPDDRHAAQLRLPARCEILAVGGATRAHSVRNGLERMGALVPADAWVLVHDAARPCLDSGETAALIDEGGRDEHGGLLALPVTDTVKRETAGRVAATVARTGLWRALTPQFFGLDVLTRALAAAASCGDEITDESSAVEALGLQPRLVPGQSTNIKVTGPGDLDLAEAILRRQGRW